MVDCGHEFGHGTAYGERTSTPPVVSRDYTTDIGHFLSHPPLTWPFPVFKHLWQWQHPISKLIYHVSVALCERICVLHVAVMLLRPL